MRSKWHFSIILHSEFDSAYPKNPGKRSTNKVLPCLIRLTLTFMFWPLTSRNKVKMTSNQKPSIGFGFSTPENPRIRIFSKCIRKLAPQLKYEFYALTIVTMLSTILCKTVQLATQGHVGILYINTCSATFRNPCPEIVNNMRWRRVRFNVVNIIQCRSCLIISRPHLNSNADIYDEMTLYRLIGCDFRLIEHTFRWE